MSNGLVIDKVPKMWGREIILHNDERYCCKLLQYDGVRISSRHYHEKKHETFVILKGRFEIDWYSLDDEKAQGNNSMGPGGVISLDPRTVHRVKCLSPEGGIIIEASSHDDPNDCVRIEPSVNPFGQST
jgi:mannose-6-phosphate isomerase-like protein (cupin superfamily)